MQKKKYKRIISGVLASLLTAQILLLGDAGNNGLISAENIQALGNVIEQHVNSEKLKAEYDEAIEGLGEVDYFELPEFSRLRSASGEISISDSLTMSGRVNLLDGRDHTKVKILIFDGWNLAAETYADANGYFEVTAYGLGAETNVKIECDGYLPRFYKGMGYGSYDVGTNVLYPGDTTYNEWENNAWSDEQINENDLTYVQGLVGKRKAIGTYDEMFDLNDDGGIDAFDLEIIEEYIADESENKEFVEEYDFNDDNEIDVNDCDLLEENTGAYIGDDEYLEYMDIDGDGEISDSDYAHFAYWIDIYENYGSWEYGDRNITDITLTGDCLNYGMSLYNTNLDLNGQSLIIDGTLNFKTSNRSLWSGTDGSRLDINGGYLYVGGYFNFGDVDCYDKIIMQNDNDVLIVIENFTYQTLADMSTTENQWNAGTIYFLGPVWQVNEPSNDKAIYSTGTHSIVFFYAYGKQHILWDNPTTYIFDENGIPNTQRRFNFDYVDEDGNLLGLIFPYGFTADRYWFRPWFPTFLELEEPDYTLYRKGWEMGDGVHIATGNYSKSFTDLSISSPGVKSDFIRTYNSMNTEEGSFGIGWDFNMDISKIVIPALGYYQIVLPDGSNTTFKDDGTGGFECLNARSTMTKDGDEYVITNAAQSKYYFNANNELYQVEDTNGNKLIVSAVENNQRVISDSTGRTYKVHYNGNEEHSRIIMLEDTTADRIVSYEYNSDFQLISATSVSGGTERYEYDRNGRLNKIINCYDEVTDEINYLSHGAVNYLVNSAGLRQVYTYDKARKQTGLQEFDGDTLVKTFEYNYDEKYAVNTNIVKTDGQTYEVDKITYNMVDGKNKYDEMSESVDIMGNTTKYERDENGNVTKTINPDGTYTLANYNDKNSITAQIDEQGYAVINAYDENGTRIIKSAKSLNQLSQADINIVTAQDFNPVIYLAANESSYAITSYEYYADSYVSGIIGLVKKSTDPEGNVTEYDYYQLGVGKGLPKEVWVYGNGVSKPVNGTRYEYNAQLQVSKEISSEGYVKEYECDKFNNVTKVKDYGTGLIPAITTTEYDLLSRKIAEYSPNYSADKSHGTLNTYYPSGSVKTQTDALGNVTTLEYNAYGNATKKTNPDGTINITEYDGLQREKATYFKSSENGVKQVLTTTSYEFVENHSFDVYSSLDIKTSKLCNGLKTTKTSYITAEKQVVTETFADFRGNTVEEKTNGETKRTSAYYTNGQLARTTDALANTTKYEYGYLGSLTKTYTPFNLNNGVVNYSVTENKYNRNGQIIEVKQTVQEQDSASEKYSITQNEYNALGLLTKIILSDGTPNGEKNITKYFYTNDGIQTKMYTGMSSESDTTYLTTEYEYDSWMRAIRTTDSTGYNSGTVTYDLNGNVLTSTDANGNITTNIYDALNRVIETNSVHPTDVSKNVSKAFTYDNMGRVSQTFHNGETISYEYDSLGRIIKENGSTFKGYFYVGISQYVDNSIVGINNLLMYSNTSYEYDDEMRVIEVRESGELTASYTYDVNGNKASETLANGVVSTYTYNNANRITSISAAKGNVNISSHEYSYYLDGSDACKTRTENGIMETTSYEYDGLKRLTEEIVSVGNTTVDAYSYEYDDYGNRSKMTATGSENYITEYDYTDSNGNYTTLLQKETRTIEVADIEDSFTGLANNPVERLNNLNSTSNVKQTVYTYDANGSQITKATDEKTETNTYNAVNQLVGFTDGEITASYTYNADGLRASKTVDGETVKHVWDGAKQIIADVKNGALYEADCYIRGTGLVAKYNYVNGAKSEYTYYTQNAHGDVINLTDTDGIVIKTYKYDAFGVEKNIDDADANTFRYCGEYYDAETATIYLRARHYNPSNGRFTQRDSYVGKQGDPLSLNLYTYCHNNPIANVDPSGHIVIALPALALAAAAVVVVSTTAIVVSNNPQAQQSFNEMTYDVERGFKDLVDSSKRVLNKVKTWGKSLTAKAKNTYETAKTVATVAGTSIITNVVTDAILFYAKRTSTSTTGEPNTTVDRTDKDGNVIGDRTYGPDGRADTDTDYTDHGNSKQHPVVPHKHRWDWTNNTPKRGPWEKP